MLERVNLIAGCWYTVEVATAVAPCAGLKSDFASCGLQMRTQLAEAINHGGLSFQLHMHNHNERYPSYAHLVNTVSVGFNVLWRLLWSLCIVGVLCVLPFDLRSFDLAMILTSLGLRTSDCFYALVVL